MPVKVYGNYVKNPVKVISRKKEGIFEGYKQLQEELAECMAGSGQSVLVVECYPGTDQEELLQGLMPLQFDWIIHSDDFAFEAEKIDAYLEKDMTSDRVFGIMTNRKLEDFFYKEKLDAVKAQLAVSDKKRILVYGVGASLLTRGTICILAELTRWEIQLRYRKGLTNWRTEKKDQPQLSKYKRGFFAEWRWADRQKKKLLGNIDYYLDMNREGRPILAEGDMLRSALKKISREPFRLNPYFDPGVWGGNWMKEHFGLEENGSNYAWCFDGVPEENSLRFQFGDCILETPALNLVYLEPVGLLGSRVHARFGTEFPIRFDLLDTMHGGNLSMQVHPLTEYIQDEFRMHYTQDESYYILDAMEDAGVYLGVKEGVSPEEMEKDLIKAQTGETVFPDERYVNYFPVKKHDHVLIPAGTLHCSGANTMVLEISATPYIFTFKLWDWGRTGLDGLPRPVHIEHGMKNIQWERDTNWVKKHLIHQEQEVYRSSSVLVERTGLHEREFIDTYRIATTDQARVQRNGSVHMLNLVDGERAIIRSSVGAFEDYEVHYGETFLLPEAAGEYEIVSPDKNEVKVILAAVR